jgi:hypothetical protein
MRTREDLSRHRRILGLLFIGANVGTLLAALFVGGILTFAGLASGDLEALPITTGLATLIGGYLALTGLPGIIVGVALYRQRPWADIAAIILAALSLPSVPFGTALAIYTLWVFLSHPNSATATT